MSITYLWFKFLRNYRTKSVLVNSMQRKLGSKKFWGHKDVPLGSRAQLGPSMDPTMGLQYNWHGPFNIAYIFAFYAKWDQTNCGNTKVDPHWAQDPPWSSNGPCHCPTIHLTWPFIYWLYFCILCNKNGVKGLWGHKGQPSLGLGPALVLQWTLPWP